MSKPATRKPRNRTPRDGAKVAEGVSSVTDIAAGNGVAATPLSGGIASNSRARELTPEQLTEAQSADTRMARMELIHDWMVRGWYLKGRTDRALAAVWGVARSTVWGYSSDAVALLRRELTGKSRDELLAEVLANIGAVGQDALERTEEVVTALGDVVEVRRPDHRTALRAAEARGELLGLKVQRMHHTTGVEQLSLEEIIAQLRDRGIRVELPALETTGEEARNEESEG